MYGFSKKLFSLDLWVSIVFIFIVVIALIWNSLSASERRVGEWWCHIEGPHTTDHNTYHDYHRHNAMDDKLSDRICNPKCTDKERAKRDKEIDKHNKHGHKQYAKSKS